MKIRLKYSLIDVISSHSTVHIMLLADACIVLNDFLITFLVVETCLHPYFLIVKFIRGTLVQGGVSELTPKCIHSFRGVG